ncbi:ParB/RepB/Spo0J family partition protein [Bradyrhizobium sp. KB893862 SZCCT0404]|uniref:ParB/RepB/Spo0J family partition protein n=1 Tax=Bradyrhizobium sp. KB893862 SZCCT0404 TaxID=2807672 RepID=UPI001BAC60CC|nr:ParB/RepB/Spo0J family partition protein [Bradyrhizobium sp. KB893862 SZCCT0404]MBR1177122.1 ParB/RepB/Spo0J family partition protein [Bradyrhizobium sp. KB893862 SZCCT0404]
MELRNIALSDLTIATVNVRHARKAPDVSDILPSIRSRGVLQPLLVRPQGKLFEIIAGRRRYFAAIKVAEEQGIPIVEVLLPCAVAADGSDVDAMEASLIENVARAPMDELEEYEAFAKLIKQGRSVAEIAKTFGLTDRYVKQRLALANLQGAIKDAYRAGRIEAEDLQLLATATRRQQKEWVTAFQVENDLDNDGESAPRGHQLKQWLFGAEQIATSAALFPLGDYKGDLIADLFGDVSYFADLDQFWALQNAAIARLKDELVAKGWKVTVLEKGTRFQAWRYDEADLDDGGEVFIEVRGDGVSETHQGYRAEQDIRPSRDGKDVQKEAPRPELTKAAENYLALHRHAIVRAELLAKPGVALRLAVAHMIVGSPLWSVKPEPQRADKEAIAETVSASPAQAAFEAEQLAVLQLLHLEKSYYGSVTRGNGDAFAAATIFAQLLTLNDEAVLRVIALVMAESLAAGSPLVEAAGLVVKPDVAQWWKMDDTFLDLLKDRTAINALLAELAGKAVADANVSEPGKVQKRIIRDCLNGEGRERVEGAFVPRYMAFPIGHYDGEKSLSLASACEIVNPLFTGP